MVSAGEHIERLPVTPAQQALAGAASRAGAADVDANGRRDGGMTLGGTIEGRQFAVAIPPNWNHQALLFAHGYSPPGSSVAVSRDPVAKDPAGSLMALAYGQGFAVAHSAYDKAGVGVESGANSTLALKHLLDRIGTARTYVSARRWAARSRWRSSRSIRASSPARSPPAAPRAGARRSRPSSISARSTIISPRAPTMRCRAIAASRSPRFPPVAPWPLRFAQPVWAGIQMKRLVAPVESLFGDAKKDPRAARPRSSATSLRRAASSGPSSRPSPSRCSPCRSARTTWSPRWAARSTTIGPRSIAAPISRRRRMAALNRGIERVAGDPAAIAYATRWHEPSGRSPVKLVAMHNAVDSLVPYRREAELAQRMAAAGNSGNLLLLTVPTKTGPLPGARFEGIAHCGFTPGQVATAWNSLRTWAETGTKPALAAR
ncbi:MAG: hypothetical protein WDN24_07955 [Sphingomonas sp.]